MSPSRQQRKKDLTPCFASAYVHFAACCKVLAEQGCEVGKREGQRESTENPE